MNLAQEAIVSAKQAQTQLEQFLDELPAFIEQHQKLVDKVQQLAKANEKLSIQLQECQLNSAKVANRTKPATFRGISIE